MIRKHLTLIVALVALAAMLSGYCFWMDTPKNKFDRIQEGMSLQNVKDILGEPMSFDFSDENDKRTQWYIINTYQYYGAYFWDEGDVFIGVGILEDKVWHKTMFRRPNTPTFKREPSLIQKCNDAIMAFLQRKPSAPATVPSSS